MKASRHVSVSSIGRFLLGLAALSLLTGMIALPASAADIQAPIGSDANWDGRFGGQGV